MMIRGIYHLSCVALLIYAGFSHVLERWLPPTSLVLLGLVVVLDYIEFRFARPMEAAVKVLKDISILHTRVEESTLKKHEAEIKLLNEKILSEKDYRVRLRIEALSKGITLPND